MASVLVVGAGIAGPVTAFWLAKAGFKVTLIERSPQMFKTGQGIDIEGPAKEVAERMKVVGEISKRTTSEEGIAFIDDNAREVGMIKGLLTRSLEILRGDLAEILVDAASSLDNVQLHYGRSLRSIHREGDSTLVTFDDDSKQSYHAVIGADGLRSATRRLAFDRNQVDQCFKPRDQYVAYFTIPREDSDEKKARWQHAVGGRSVLVRPARGNLSSAYVQLASKSDELEAALQSRDKTEQKEVWARLFADMGGVAPRVISQMKDSEDFYFERIAQIKLDTWHNGAVALVGDAAYAPSPITGEGTNLALVGAYVLAGELSKSPDNPEAAFKAYEDRLMAFVEKAQTIPLGGIAPKLAQPQTWWGIWILRTLFALVAWTGIWKLVDPGEPEAFDFPDYPKLDA